MDGRLSISKNVVENAIRPFTVGRKTWLFADTPKGAKASAAVYSLVETAKANGLNVIHISGIPSDVHARFRLAELSGRFG